MPAAKLSAWKKAQTQGLWSPASLATASAGAKPVTRKNMMAITRDTETLESDRKLSALGKLISSMDSEPLPMSLPSLALNQ